MTDARREQSRDNLETPAAQLTQTELSLLDVDDLRRIITPTLLLSGEQSPPLMRLLTERPTMRSSRVAKQAFNELFGVRPGK